jgi:hypothetical protein
MSGARHRDGWFPVLLRAAFLALALGGGAAWPAVGGGHGGSFSGGGHGGVSGGHGGGSFPRGPSFRGRGFGGRPVPHDGRPLFVFPYFYDPYFGYDQDYPGYPYNAYCDPYSPYYAPQYC